MAPARLSILIPVYNEASSIRAVLNRVAQSCASRLDSEHVVADLIVVDDGSRDGSATQIEAFSSENARIPLQLIRHPVNRGKGAAIRTAIAHAESDFCLIQDADFEYDPFDYPKLLQPLLSDEADVVVGSRFMNASQRRPFGFWQAAANRAISVLAGMAAGLALSDVESGYKAFRTSLAKSIPLFSNRFGLDPELIIQFAKRHARFIEVPINYKGRTHEQGKKIGASDAVSAAAIILRTWLLSPAHTDPAAEMLEILSRAKRFNRWMADTITPFLHGDVLELGAGIGNLTLLLSSRAGSYVATDNDPLHLSELRSRTAYRSNIRVESYDFSDSENIVRFQESADTVVCLNVLEHVGDDAAGFANIHRCLRPGGTAIVLVPQGPQAFGSLDEVLDHKRRYTEADLRRKMADAGFTVSQLIAFNHASWPGWYLNSRILRRRTLSRTQVLVFNWLVPVLRRIDDHLPWPPTSLIAIGRVAMPPDGSVGFAPADWVLALLTVLLLLAAFLWRPRTQHWFVNLAMKTRTCMAVLFVLPIAMRLLLLAQHPVPTPEIYDEFSHLLLADTLLHGRLANPPHALPQFFETFFVLQQPTYSSIYPLGQALLLAFGRLFTGVPWAGVLIAAGGFCSACYWMLRGWVTPQWALLGGVVAVIEFGPLCQWTNSYWGGSLAATAGCLVFGALPRFREEARARDAVLLGVGFSLHMLTRQFETVFLLLAILLWFAPDLRRKSLLRICLYASAAILPVVILILLQNKAVTNSWTILPEQLSQYQYGVPSALTIQANPTPHLPLTPQQATDYKAQSLTHGPGTDSFDKFILRLEYRVRYYRFFFLPPLYLALFAFLFALRTRRRDT